VTNGDYSRRLPGHGLTGGDIHLRPQSWGQSFSTLHYLEGKRGLDSWDVKKDAKEQRSS